MSHVTWPCVSVATFFTLQIQKIKIYVLDFVSKFMWAICSTEASVNIFGKLVKVALHFRSKVSYISLQITLESQKNIKIFSKLLAAHQKRTLEKFILTLYFFNLSFIQVSDADGTTPDLSLEGPDAEKFKIEENRIILDTNVTNDFKAKLILVVKSKFKTIVFVK